MKNAPGTHPTGRPSAPHAGGDDAPVREPGSLRPAGVDGAPPVPAPTDQQLRDYYANHKELFVEPEKVRVSVILLKVDPSAPKASWDSARARPRSCGRNSRRERNFAKLARLHSGDAARQGRRHGYLHRGMLPDGVDAVVEKLKPAEISQPVTLLEGVALLRLEARQPAQQRSFNDVRARTPSCGSATNQSAAGTSCRRSAQGHPGPRQRVALPAVAEGDHEGQLDR